MADMFLTNEMPSMGRASTSSGVAPLARARVGSLSPAAALSAPPLSGTPATSESRADVVAGMPQILLMRVAAFEFFRGRTAIRRREGGEAPG